MPTQSKPPAPDYRSRLYESVRISKKAKKAITALARKDRRSIIATIDMLAGV